MAHLHQTDYLLSLVGVYIEFNGVMRNNMNFMHTKKKLYFIYLALFLSPFMAKTETPQNGAADHRPWITIFVHGTSGATYTLLNFNGLLSDNYENTIYQKLQSRNKKQALIHKKCFLFEDGLHKISLEDPTTNRVASAFATIYHEILGLVDHRQAENASYYTFGWSGLLSQKARRQEAIAFYSSLSQEIAYYNKQGLNPRIRIICHSHGGNIALNLAGIHAFLNKNIFQETITNTSVSKISQNISPEIFANLDPGLVIDELILLATPIQIETEEFCTSPLFKKILSFYSHTDIVQISDFVSTDGPGSKHTIDQRYISPKIMQIHCSVTRHDLQPKAMPAITSAPPQETISNKQAVVTLLKGLFRGKESNDMLPAIEKMIQGLVYLSDIPKEKDFDYYALKKELCAIQKNMIAHPHDPVHTDFVYGLEDKTHKSFSTLPLILWAPLFATLLQANNPDQTEVDQHIILNYYDKTMSFEAQNTSGSAKKIDVPEDILRKLKTTFYACLN